MPKSPHTRCRTRVAASIERSAPAAVQQVAGEVDAGNADLVFLFVSPRYDVATVAAEWQRIGAGPTIACTTAGEISSSLGYSEGSIVAASLRGVDALLVELPDLGTFDAAAAEQVAAATAAFRAAAAPDEQVCGILIMDGLSMREEVVAAHLHRALEAIPIVGGSAGDELSFGCTRVLVGGTFRSGCGVLALIRATDSTVPFMVHHFEPTGRELVVTKADPRRRRIHELEGAPAADVYRRAVGLDGGPLTPPRLALNPLMLRIGEHHFVRSLIKENEDKSIDLYGAIAEGLVLDVGRPTELVGALRRTLDGVRSRVGEPDLLLTFDGIPRRLEMQTYGDGQDVSRLFSRFPTAGFSTYGETYCGLHVNQTMTGIAFGGGGFLT